MFGVCNNCSFFLFVCVQFRSANFYPIDFKPLNHIDPYALMFHAMTFLRDRDSLTGSNPLNEGISF